MGKNRDVARTEELQAHRVEHALNILGRRTRHDGDTDGNPKNGEYCALTAAAILLSLRTSGQEFNENSIAKYLVKHGHFITRSVPTLYN